LKTVLVKRFTLGAGAGKFWGAKDFYPNFPEKFSCGFYLQISFHKDYEDLFVKITQVWCDLQIRSSFVFGEKKSNIGRHFCQDFQGFFPDLRQIKIFGVRFHPLHPRLLHHCLVLPLTSNSRPSGETSRWPRLACQHCKIYERDRVASGL